VRQLVGKHSDAELKMLVREVALEWQASEADPRSDAIERIASHIFNYLL
jgi:hypothetical protein